MTHDLDALSRLTKLILDTELARLHRRSGELAQQEALSDALSRSQETRRNQLAHAPTRDTDLAFATGQDALWQAWLARRKRSLNSDLAQSAARVEEQRQRALVAFGRAQALSGLQKNMAEDRQSTRSRRRQYD